MEREEFGSETSDTSDNTKSKSITKTKQQLEKIISFVEINGDFTKGKPSKNLLAAWDVLTDELNEIGPPYHTNLEWRSIWSAHKGNLKRKSSASIAVIKPKIVKAGKAVQSCSRLIEVQSEQSNNSEDDKQNENIQSMFNRLINKIDTFVEQQKESNELLRELVSILKPQSLDESPNTC